MESTYTTVLLQCDNTRKVRICNEFNYVGTQSYGQGNGKKSNNTKGPKLRPNFTQLKARRKNAALQGEQQMRLKKDGTPWGKTGRKAIPKELKRINSTFTLPPEFRRILNSREVFERAVSESVLKFWNCFLTFEGEISQDKLRVQAARNLMGATSILYLGHDGLTAYAKFTWPHKNFIGAIDLDLARTTPELCDYTVEDLPDDLIRALPEHGQFQKLAWVKRICDLSFTQKAPNPTPIEL